MGLQEFEHSVSMPKGLDLKEMAVNAEAADRLGKMAISADPRKFGLNHSVSNRLAMGAAAVSVLGAGGSLFGPQVPDPKIYYDGVGMRNTSDLGADGNYAKAIMGRHAST